MELFWLIMVSSTFSMINVLSKLIEKLFAYQGSFTSTISDIGFLDNSYVNWEFEVTVVIFMLADSKTNLCELTKRRKNLSIWYYNIL
jgi:hypothetical protein